MKLSERIFRGGKHKITSPFGQRNAVYDSKGKLVAKAGMHNGCDYGTYGVKLPQYALEDGIVLSAGKDSTGAIFAWVRYSRLGIELLHYHLDSVNVSKGQAVNKDTIIGYTGTTGNSTGIHLHLGFRKVGSTQYYDPESYDYVEYVAPIIEPTPSNEEVYIVVAGDTLSKIASKYNTTYQKLAEYNGIANPNLIYPGQKIKIPSSNNSSNSDPIIYTIKKGDTLSAIAKKYGTTWQKIYEDNKGVIGKNPNLIIPGQVIKIIK